MKLIGFRCINFKKIFGHYFKYKKLSEFITVFVKYIVFQNVGFSCLIEQQYQFEFNIEQQCPYCIYNRPWYNTNIYSQLSGLDFEDLFTAEQQDGYYLMFSIDTYEKFHPDCYDYVTSGGYRQLTGGLTTDVLDSLSNTLNSIYI